MKRETVNTDKSPAAIGPYSQAVKANGVLYTSGILPLVPETGKLCEGGIEKQTEQVFSNLTAICEKGGTSLENALLMSVYITDMGKFEAMNRVYARFFANTFPARATVEVSALARGADIEIQAIVFCG